MLPLDTSNVLDSNLISTAASDMRGFHLFAWPLPAYLCLLSIAILANAQANGVPPSTPPTRPPTKPMPGSVPARPGPSGPLFKDLATEKLLLKPLADGKVSTHFEFEYVNRDGVPRDPRTLGNEDHGKQILLKFFIVNLIDILGEPSTTLRILPTVIGANLERICSCGNAFDS
jgi:hypothetical protein